jgi:hypothetical protein
MDEKQTKEKRKEDLKKPNILSADSSGNLFVNGRPLKYRIGDSAREKKEKQEKQQ